MNFTFIESKKSFDSYLNTDTNAMNPQVVTKVDFTVKVVKTSTVKFTYYFGLLFIGLVLFAFTVICAACNSNYEVGICQSATQDEWAKLMYINIVGCFVILVFSMIQFLFHWKSKTLIVTQPQV